MVSRFLWSLLACGLTLWASAAVAQANDCRTDRFPIYDATTGQRINGVVRSCSDRIEDLTPPPYQIRPGQSLFMVGGRFIAAGSGANVRNAFVRAQVNYPYILRSNEPDVFVMEYFGAKPGIQWSQVSRTLPFLPREVYYLDKMEGFPRYGYGGLATLPSLDSEARPLNEKSVIISIDGFGFMSPDAWRGIMLALGPARYVEVIFFQGDEDPKILRRAFVFMRSRSSVATSYSQVIGAYPVFKDSPVWDNPSLAGALRYGAAIVTLFAVYAAYYQTGFARQLESPCDGLTTCWHDPLLDVLAR